MEERLNAILQRIEASTLPEEDKIKIYGIISEGLKASIWPALMSCMPKDTLDAFLKQPAKATVESYISLIEDATKSGKALDEAEETMNKLLDEVETVLTEEKI